MSQNLPKLAKLATGKYAMREKGTGRRGSPFSSLTTLQLEAALKKPLATPTSGRADQLHLV